MKKDNKETKKEYIIEYNMTFVNIFAIVLLILMIFITYLLTITNISRISVDLYQQSIEGINSIIILILMILWMVLHEIIHGIAYQIGGAKKDDIVYGASIENGVFYCKAKKYINKKCIMLSLLSPLVLIGIVTFIIGIIFTNAWLVILSILNVSGAAGDIMMFIFFLRQKEDVEFRELGFSSPAVIKTTENISLNKYMGIKNIREATDKKEITEEDEKLITISKGTWIFISVILGISIISVILNVLIK